MNIKVKRFLFGWWVWEGHNDLKDYFFIFIGVIIALGLMSLAIFVITGGK